MNWLSSKSRRHPARPLFSVGCRSFHLILGLIEVVILILSGSLFSSSTTILFPLHLSFSTQGLSKERKLNRLTAPPSLPPSMFFPSRLKRYLPSSKPIPVPVLLTTFTFLLLTAAYLSFDLPFSTSPLSLDDERAELNIDLLLPKTLSEGGGKTDLFNFKGEFRKDRETRWMGGIPGWCKFASL